MTLTQPLLTIPFIVHCLYLFFPCDNPEKQGFERLSSDIEMMIGRRPNIYFKVAWKGVSVAVVIFIFAFRYNHYRIRHRLDPSVDPLDNLSKPKNFCISFPSGQLKQVTRGHITVADGWAGTSNSHPHPKPTTRLKHTKKVSKMFVFPLLNSMIPDGPTDQRTNGRTMPLIELCVRN